MATAGEYGRSEMTMTLPGSPEAPLESVAEFSFKGAQAGVEQLALRDDDHVEAWRKFVLTENLSNQSFSSISLNRAAQLARRGNPESPHCQRIA